MDAIRVGLLGLNFGRKLIESGQKNGSLELVICHDLNPAARADFAREFSCEASQSYPQMAQRDDIEAIIITSPNHLHPEHAYLAASNGKHVHMAKPLANSLAEALEMIDFCREAGVKLAVGHNDRYYGHIKKIREIFRQDKIGQPISVECHLSASNAFTLSSPATGGAAREPAPVWRPSRWLSTLSIQSARSSAMWSAYQRISVT